MKFLSLIIIFLNIEFEGICIDIARKHDSAISPKGEKDMKSEIT